MTSHISTLVVLHQIKENTRDKSPPPALAVFLMLVELVYTTQRNTMQQSHM